MTPFPYRPMIAIFASVLSQMMVQYSIFSYVGFMVKHLGVVDDIDKAGYFAGILSSGFMVGRFLTSYFWGWFADRYGRRLVILIALWSTVALSIAFGFSWTFWWAFLSRFLMGALNGLLAVSKTLVSEICGKEHDINGMGVVTVACSLGIIVGAGLGAILMEPATHFPLVFSESGIFGRFPFLLANVSVAGFALVAFPLVLLFLPASRTPIGASKRNRVVDCENNVNTPVEEIAEAKVSEAFPPSQPSVPPWAPQHGTSPQSPAGIEGSWAPSPGRKAPAGLLKQPHVRLLLLNYGLYSFVHTGFDEVFSLWVLSSIASGGLNWGSQRIGKVLITSGFVVFLFDIVAVPCITARLGTKLSQRLGSIAEVPAYVIFPMIVHLRGTSILDIATIILLFIIYAGSNSFYLAVSLAINNSTDASRRGEVNGLAMTVGSISKAAGPAVCSALFAFSIDGNHPFPVDVHLAWYTFALLRFVVGFLGLITIKDGGGGNVNKPDGSLDGIELGEIGEDVVSYRKNSNGTVATRMGLKLDECINSEMEKKDE